jgi:hypothetical protein
MKTSFRFQAVTLFALVAASTAAAQERAGPLEVRLNRLYRLGEDFSPCELTVAEKDFRYSVVQALDDREDEFRDYLRSGDSPSARSFYRSNTQIGPLTLSPRPEGPAPTKNMRDGWISTFSGWKDLYEELARLGDTEVDERWVKLRTLAKANLGDDERRNLDGVSMSASAHGIAQAAKLGEAIRVCLESVKNSTLDPEKCADLKKPEAFQDALLLTPSGKDSFATFASATKDHVRIRALRSLASGIRPYVSYFDPIRHSWARFTDEETLRLSLDAGDMRGYETELGLLIEKFWSLEGNRLQIEWMTSTRSSPIFMILFDDSALPTSFVDPKAYEIVLGQGTYESTPARQIGRALGFRDRYLSVWRPDLCKYEDQVKPADLLSDSRFGSITKEHWDSLRKAYGKGESEE